MTTTIEKPKTSNLVTLVKFFGKKDGQSSLDLANEIRELTEVEQTEIAEGIRDGSFDY